VKSGCRFFFKGEKRIRDLDPSEIMETKHNEPLVSWRSLDGQEALDALWDSMGWATYVSDDTLLAFSEILAHEEELLVLLASSFAIAARADYAKTVPSMIGHTLRF
jgi:threonine synthase